MQTEVWHTSLGLGQSPSSAGQRPARNFWLFYPGNNHFFQYNHDSNSRVCEVTAKGFYDSVPNSFFSIQPRRHTVAQINHPTRVSLHRQC